LVKGQSVVFLKPHPIKLNAGVGFSFWCNVTVANKTEMGILGLQLPDELLQSLVLRFFKNGIAVSFELNANRKIVATCAPFKLGLARMPSPILRRYKLNNAPGAGNQKVARYPSLRNVRKVGVCLRIQLVLKKINDVLRAVLGSKLPWRQANVVQHHQIRRGFTGSRIKIRGDPPCCRSQPAP
jgi:hypothetical protein